MANLIYLRFDNNLTDDSGKSWAAQGGTVTYDATIKKRGTHSSIWTAGYYIRTARAADLDVATNPFSIEGWAYVTTLTDGNDFNIMYLRQDASVDARLYLINRGGVYKLGYVAHVSGAHTIGDEWTVSAFALSTWCHCAVSRLGTRFAVYFNGKRVDDLSVYNYSPEFAAGYARVGDDAIGNIDEVIMTDYDKYPSDFNPDGHNPFMKRRLVQIQDAWNWMATV
jgi:hypothetical protein